MDRDGRRLIGEGVTSSRFSKCLGMSATLLTAAVVLAACASHAVSADSSTLCNCQRTKEKEI
jgi:hypothetical protein